MNELFVVSIILFFCRYQKTFNMLHMLEMEKHTWQLINVLFHDRLEKELQDMQMAVDDIVRTMECNLIRTMECNLVRIMECNL